MGNHRLLRDFHYWCDGDFDRPCALPEEGAGGHRKWQEKGSFQGISRIEIDELNLLYSSEHAS